jgi:hypothetical protein
MNVSTLRTNRKAQIIAGTLGIALLGGGVAVGASVIDNEPTATAAGSVRGDDTRANRSEDRAPIALPPLSTGDGTYTTTITQVVAPNTVTKKTDTLDKGVTKVQDAGTSGLRAIDTRVVVKDGKTVSSTEVGRRVLKPTSPRVVLVGTHVDPKPTPAPTATAKTSSTSTRSTSTPKPTAKPTPKPTRTSTPSSGGGAPSGAWAKVAQCESGGNPRANTGNGYYGLYQFSQSTWRSVGGTGLPSNASASEQTMRAQMLYNRAGAGQWPVCGRYLR